ncbi:MAG: M24 family metallopeptidase [Akkermansiaceae bacterium]
MNKTARTTILAGNASTNATLYHRTRFIAPDACVMIEFADGGSLLLVRDLEMERARKHAKADRICCAADFTPASGLSGDRDTALAQAAAECLKQHGQSDVIVDRTLPYLYAHHIEQVGIKIEYSEHFGVIARRIKDEEEIEHLRYAQKITGEAMTYACRMIANSKPDKDGILHSDGAVLTSEIVRYRITAFLNEKNFSNSHDSIVVTTPHVADCHHFGSGPLKADIPIIVDIFPMDNQTRYCGDMTRTVVCGEASEEVRKMHAVVAEAKVAGCNALRAGTTGEAVHKATIEVILKHGYSNIRGSSSPTHQKPAMHHGTGHGIGLDVHEPILLDNGGGEIFSGEIFTVEPGLYSAEIGGVRLEDMVLVIEESHQVLSNIQESLNWKF